MKRTITHLSTLWTWEPHECWAVIPLQPLSVACLVSAFTARFNQYRLIITGTSKWWMLFIYHFTNWWLQCDCANVSLIFQPDQLKRRSGKSTLKTYDEGESMLLAARAKGSVIPVTKNSISGGNINNSQIVSRQVKNRVTGIDYNTPSSCIWSVQPDITATVILRLCSGGTSDRKLSERLIFTHWPCFPVMQQFYLMPRM